MTQPKQLSASAAIVALMAGVIFAAGLTISGMTDPQKVQGFLNIGAIFSTAWGEWDPSLAFVMGGALAVSFLAYLSIRQLKAPWYSEKFDLPTRRDIDYRLVLGAMLFGIGWAIGGYCPGPALASALVGGADIIYFISSMIVGMLIAKRIVR